MENLKTTQATTDTEVLLTLLSVNKWDYQAYRSKYGEDALSRLKGMTDDILELMRQNHDFSQKPGQAANGLHMA